MVPRKRGDDSRRVLPWTLLLSLLVHAVLIPVLLWVIVARYIAPTMRPPEEASLQSSTAVTIARRNRPVARPRTKPMPIVRERHVPQPTAAPPPAHVLAQIQTHAPPRPLQQPRKISFGDQLAAQERAFAQEAQQLHAQNNPLSVATSVPAPTSIHRSYFDNPANVRRTQGFMAYLSSIKQWYDGDLSCHYAHYVTYMNGGGSDEGDIPWPVCYPRDHDLLSMQSYRQIALPVPVPQPGYVLPADTYISPWLRDNVYDRRPP